MVFLSLFETDPRYAASSARRRNCTTASHAPPIRTVASWQPFDELIESGAVVGLNFPVALNPALAKTIGTMMKIDYQRAVQLRIPRMDAEPERHYPSDRLHLRRVPELRHGRRR